MLEKCCNQSAFNFNSQRLITIICFVSYLPNTESFKYYSWHYNSWQGVIANCQHSICLLRVKIIINRNSSNPFHYGMYKGCSRHNLNIFLCVTTITTIFSEYETFERLYHLFHTSVKTKQITHLVFIFIPMAIRDTGQ